MAVARAAADSAGLQLFRYLGGPNAHVLPVPMMNIMNGGAHADSNVDIQEFMIAPVGAPTFTEALRWGAETYHALKAVLKQHGLSTGVGDEGGFAPNLEHNRAALDLIIEAIGKAGYVPGRDIALAIDAAATEFHHDGAYHFDGKPQTSAGMSAIYADWLRTTRSCRSRTRWPRRTGPAGSAFTAEVGDRVQVVGDDIFVTNPERLRRGIAEKSANALLVKVNQIGTVSETFDAVSLAHRAGFACMISHRSGETDDTFIADLAVATNAARSRPAPRPAASGSPSTTSCCASRSTSPTRPATRARPRSRGSPPRRRFSLIMSTQGQPSPEQSTAPAVRRAGRRHGGGRAVHRLTGRAALLAVVICAIALSLAYPVREYIAQRQQIDQLLAAQQTMPPR